MNGINKDDPQKIEIIVIGKMSHTSNAQLRVTSFVWYLFINELICELIALVTGKVSPGNTRGISSDLMYPNE